MLRVEHKADKVRVNELRISARIEKAPRPGVVLSSEADDTAHRRLCAGGNGNGRRWG